ncbi:hypothetical protein [Streptomyces adelaidensis]|uniref:hypothetical protein n=1 Tax=Streptomyces adelaidensis TaxID=2796465 RepID=UPI001905CB9C|nr:hypothetical protein [Streptomyces adelaidensis]
MCATQPSAEVWGALLAFARLRRAGRLVVSLDAQQDPGEARGLVRVYVLLPEEGRYAFSARRIVGVAE